MWIFGVALGCGAQSFNCPAVVDVITQTQFGNGQLRKVREDGSNPLYVRFELPLEWCGPAFDTRVRDGGGLGRD